MIMEGGIVISYSEAVSAVRQFINEMEEDKQYELEDLRAYLIKKGIRLSEQEFKKLVIDEYLMKV